MKILHTADWHLGHRLHERSQFQEQSAFLDWLKNYILDNKVDVLLVAGDIFDTGVPSAQSLKLYYTFLADLRITSCKHIIITGGNHDAPGTLDAPKDILKAFNIQVIGKAKEDITDEVFSLEVNNQKLIIAAVPYLRDRDIRRAVAGETFDQIGDRYKHALINHYNEIAAHCEKIKKGKEIIIAMGHLFAIGGSTSDSENTIYVGGEGDIGADDFPTLFDYIALGHLHRPQIIGGKENIRYSGSPNILSFSEVGYDKKIVELEINNNKIDSITAIDIPIFRQIVRIKGSSGACIQQLNELSDLQNEKENNDLCQKIDNYTIGQPSFTPWVEVILNDKTESNLSYSGSDSYRMNKAAEGLNLEILKITLNKSRELKGLEQLVQSAMDVKTLSPLETFKIKCKEENFDLENNVEIYDAFCEALEIAKGQ